MPRKPFRMPDPALPLRAFVAALPGLAWLVVLALAAWWHRPETTAELVERLDRETRAMTGRVTTEAKP